MRASRTLAFIALATLASAASAHTDGAAHSHHSFFSGFTHPLFGLDHLAAMVAVGLWSALSARRAGPELLWGPVGFASLLLVGAMLGLQGIAIPAVEPMIAASLLATGLLVVSRLRVPGIVAALGVGVFALFHGLAHGYELAGSDSAWQTLAGMLCATVLLHCGGLAAGWALRRRTVWLARAAGAGVAALGGAMLLQLA
jgi:urease accessory protein